MFGVRWSGPASPTVVHAAGDQAIAAFVFTRDEISPSVLEKVSASSVSSPWMVSDVTAEVASSAWN